MRIVSGGQSIALSYMVDVRSNLRDGQVRHHPLVTVHDPATVSCPSGFDCDFLGVKTRRAFYSGMLADSQVPPRPPDYPPFDEEYFDFLSTQSGSTGLVIGQPGDPRTYGLTVRGSF